MGIIGGDLATLPRASFADRFWVRVDKTDPDGHWIWNGKRKPVGYGVVVTPDGRQRAAHDVAWELVNGSPFPAGLQGDHVCLVTSCVRPDADHVEPVTQQVNLDRSLRRRTHCQHGHDLRLPGALRSGTKAGCIVCKRVSVNRCLRKIRARAKERV